jgi:uncharacterized protein with PIN domain
MSMMFLVDRMLGRLIAWLRIFGYDTKSAPGKESTPKEDTELIELAKREKRILVSRDHVLIERARKAGVDAVLVKSDDVKEQLDVLIQKYPLKIDPEMTRCTACNGTIRETTRADADNIKNNKEVPEHLIAEGTRLWICDACGKVYWKGSHWRNILKTTEEIRNGKRYHV